jgi:aryl-alcohol dehydrogenase-like predicted oxidoreductase
VEEDVLPTCRELGIGFVPYSPLGRGFLTGRFQDRSEFSTDDFRANLPRFTQAAMNANRRIVEAIAQMANQKNCTPAQLSLAWVLSKGLDIVAIPGTKQLRYIDENISATEIILSAQEQEQLEAATAQVTVVGERYTAEGMKGVNA